MRDFARYRQPRFPGGIRIESKVAAVIVDRLAVSYWEGWDPRARAAVGPLSLAVAAERDRAGQQYAVLLAAAGRPAALIEVAWGEIYCGVHFFDPQLRRVFTFDCRLLAERRLFMLASKQWRYADAAQPEFDENASRREFQVSPDGQARGEIYGAPGEPSGGYTPDPPASGSYWLDVPRFGGWGPLIRAFSDALAALDLEVTDAVILDDCSDPGGEGLPDGPKPFHPPRPLQPEHLDLLFTAGARIIFDTGDNPFGIGDTVIVELRPAGVLRMPSGQLIATDPGWIGIDEPYTATVAPGAYPVLLSLVRWVDDPDHSRVAAAKLIIGDDPVVSWEQALRPGEDLRHLADGQFFGFGVDAGKACFCDVLVAPAMKRLLWPSVSDPAETPASRQLFETLNNGDNCAAELGDLESGANLIAFSSGWGDGAYPTWIGRTSTGDIGCFVIDMLLFKVLSFTRPGS
jgi:hypothetical protein